MASWSDFQGLNRAYALDLYERFRQDPGSVDADTRSMFERMPPPPESLTAAAVDVPVDAIVGAANLAESIRRYGHLAAQLDPLGSAPSGDPLLDPAAHRLKQEDLERLPGSLVGGPACQE